MNNTTIWIIVLFAGLVIEFVTPINLLTLWFSVGALGGVIGSVLSLSFEIQITLFLTISILCLILVSPLTTQLLKGDTQATNSDRILKTRFTLECDLPPNQRQQHTVNDAIWSIISFHPTLLPKGTYVEVVSIDGVKLVIKPIN